jgi:DNA segregation ATPase FtsK/SpoIIIE, S-DNA-T family
MTSTMPGRPGPDESNLDGHLSDVIPFPRNTHRPDDGSVVSAGDTIDARPEDTPDTHFEVELDPEPVPGGAVVDLPPARQPVLSTREGHHPIIPAGLRGWANAKATLMDAARRAGHVLGYHAVRSPWYALQTAGWAIVGVFRLAGRQLRWWWVAEQHALRQHAANTDDR